MAPYTLYKALTIQYKIIESIQSLSKRNIDICKMIFFICSKFRASFLMSFFCISLFFLSSTASDLCFSWSFNPPIIKLSALWLHISMCTLCLLPTDIQQLLTTYYKAKTYLFHLWFKIYLIEWGFFVEIKKKKYP